MQHLLLMLLLLAFAPVARGDSSTPSTLPPGFGVGTDQIKTLRMVGRLSVQMETPRMSTNLVMSYQLHFERPDRLSIRQHDHTLVANGTSVMVQATRDDLTRYAEAPQTQALERLVVFQSAQRSPLNEIAALVSPDPAAFWSQTLQGKTVEQLPDEEVGGTSCHVYRWELMKFREHAMGVRVWMDPTYGLIRRLHTEVLSDGTNRNENISGLPILELTYDEITINQPLPVDAFAFTPSPGARRMRQPERLFLRRLQQPSSALLGRPAPDFTLDLLDGTSFQLAAQTGRVVVIDFWATWCGPCLRALPAVNQLARDFQDRGVVFLGLSIDPPAKRDQVLQCATSNRLVYAVGLDTNQLGRAYGVSGIPHLAIIDAHGLLQFTHVGYDPELTNTVAGVLNQVLDGQTPVRGMLLSEEEKTALAEEEAAMALRQAALDKPNLDPELFDRRWTQPARSLRTTALPAPIAVHLAPPTYAVVADQQLVVVDATDGQVRHRIPLAAELRQPDIMGQEPTGVFLRHGTNSVGVLLQHIYEVKEGMGFPAYRHRASVVTAVDLNGTLQWQTNLSTQVQELEIVPGLQAPDRLLLTGWRAHQLLNADGTEAAAWDTGSAGPSWMLEGDENGRPEILQFGSETTLFELRAPAAEGTP